MIEPNATAQYEATSLNPEYRKRITSTKGLVPLWDFEEEAGQNPEAQGARKLKKLIAFMNLLFLSFLFFNSTSFAQSKLEHVNVFMGTSNSRWMLFPGPTMPMGMVKFSPDNQREAWCAGYEYTINQINGFSLIHGYRLSGPTFMPTTGKNKFYPGAADAPAGTMWSAGYKSRILKETEHGEVGKYEVKLYDYDIKTEITSTTRCAMMRNTYPKNDNSHLLMDFNVIQEYGKYDIKDIKVKRVSDRQVEGYGTYSFSSGMDYTVYFVTRFDKPFLRVNGWKLGKSWGTRFESDFNKPADQKHDFSEYKSDGESGIWFDFKTEANEVIQMQTAISFVSVEQAKSNMQAELDNFNWSFDAVVAANKAAWSSILDGISIETDNKTLERAFYTSMYRAYTARMIMSDANGKYTDMYEKTQQLAKGSDAVYGSDALWGAQWNLFPFWTLTNPKMANSWVNSLLAMADVGGWLPKAPLGVEYGDIMIGNHGIFLLVSAYQKGIRNFDVQKGYRAIKKVSLEEGLQHPAGGYAGTRNLNSYMKLGYVPNEEGPVSNTLDYAFSDWAVAQMAKSLKDKKTYDQFMKRSLNYRNVYDSSVGFFRQKSKDGSWVTKWDSLKKENNGWFGGGYVEGNAWDYSFFVPHDMPGLAKLVGVDRLNRRLDQRLLHIGNQPTMQSPWLYNYTGKPWETQKYLREILGDTFDDSPYKGWLGEEDEGQMSSYFIMSSLGFFEMDGGCSVKPYYDISSPLYKSATIKLDKEYYGGKTIQIKTNNFSKENIYIQRVTWNRKPLKQPRITHAELVKGGVLEYTLGEKPNTTLFSN